MDQKHIDSFLAVYETGSVTLAAQQINISQPALSRRLQEMQELLGLCLFEPSGRGIRPTPAARAILPELTQASSALQNVAKRARTMRGADGGEVTVGATPQLIETVLAEFLPTFAKDHAAVTVKLVEGGGAELQKRILNREITVGITAEPGVESGLKIRHLWNLDLLAVGGLPQGAAHKAEVSVRALGERNILALNDRFQSRKVLEAAFRLEGMRPKIVFESSSTHALTALAGAGLGVAIVPSTAGKTPGASRITQGNRPVQIGIGAIWHGRTQAIDSMTAFVDALEKHLERKPTGL